MLGLAGVRPPPLRALCSAQQRPLIHTFINSLILTAFTLSSTEVTHTHSLPYTLSIDEYIACGIFDASAVSSVGPPWATIALNSLRNRLRNSSETIRWMTGSRLPAAYAAHSAAGTDDAHATA